MNLSDQEWKDKLNDEQYHILRKRGTEAPFSGELLNNKETGEYLCAGCGSVLFSSDHKFDSGSGWPSFSDVAASDTVNLSTDYSHGMIRSEVTCATCGGHLGHLFDDGPQDTTGKRYCINSAALEFQGSEEDGSKVQ